MEKKTIDRSATPQVRLSCTFGMNAYTHKHQAFCPRLDESTHMWFVRSRPNTQSNHLLFPYLDGSGRPGRRQEKIIVGSRRRGAGKGNRQPRESARAGRQGKVGALSRSQKSAAELRTIRAARSPVA
jgi:hypothetical protein